MYITIGRYTFHVEDLHDCEIFVLCLKAYGLAGVEYWLCSYCPRVAA